MSQYCKVLKNSFAMSSSKSASKVLLNSSNSILYSLKSEPLFSVYIPIFEDSILEAIALKHFRISKTYLPYICNTGFPLIQSYGSEVINFRDKDKQNILTLFIQHMLSSDSIVWLWSYKLHRSGWNGQKYSWCFWD